MTLSRYINRYDVYRQDPIRSSNSFFLSDACGSFEVVKLFSGVINAFGLAVFGFKAAK
jgi:hypothetical protein